MKHLLQFDTYASGPEVNSEVQMMLRTIPGVQGIEVLEALEGSPRFAVMLDVDDAQADAVARRLAALTEMYRGDAWNQSMRAYREID